METFRAAACSAIALWLAMAPVLEGHRQRSLPSTDRLVNLASDYILIYQEAFKFLIADESSTQRAISPVSPDQPSESRTTRGEIFITYLDRERHWTVVHDVAEVDGIPVADREDIGALLGQGTVSSVARRIFDRNSRFNIGRVQRNFNDPMLALLPFGRERRSRFSFSRKQAESAADGTLLATVAFEERERPTIVRDVQGRSVFAKGEVLIEVATGVVRRTHIGFRHDDIDADLTTDFAREEKLALWVPVLFRERYEASRNRQRDVTVAESSYTNYRRFQVTGRVR